MLPFAALHPLCQTLPAHRCHEERFPEHLITAAGSGEHPAPSRPGTSVALACIVLCHSRHTPLVPAWQGSRRGRSRQAEAQHGSQRPRSCHGSWGDKPLETPSVGGSGDIVSDPITLHPFRALRGFLCPSPAALPSRPSPRSDFITARSDRGAPAGGAGGDVVRSTQGGR